ncbi:benzyl alcohol O-benzoyltransferase-like [Salvia hispanica]|uniref:benzyl alcohol O-benzoyltransferase-like n=1 Tax=Salvia hispanica TaxID=49212 RepID=UPI0020092DC7|nr:benzyl alcohol O-benzoyltransferase-like [Salvia hispanica]
MESTKRLTLSVTRKTPELLCPAESTPHEFKFLSDIDDQIFLRRYVKTIYFYKNNPSMKGKDPVKIIREAIAKALVFYYPLAGRLREHTGRKLVVECTGQGVVFVEADADATLHYFGDSLYPPFPNSDDLVLDVPNNLGIIVDIPLMFIQVTRLKCGGFIFSNCFNHTMCDGVGFSQFHSAVGELARGATFPSIRPVWDRHLLTSSIPHLEYGAGTRRTPVPTDQMVERSFLFTSAEISALRRSLPPHLQRCSKFDIAAGCTWRCQTIALSLKPDEEMKFIGVMDNRKNVNPPLPVGYYGNVLKLLVAVTTAGELSKNPLHYAVELVRSTKYEAETACELSNSADLMVIRDPLSLTSGNTYTVSNLTHLGLDQMDVGWGTAAYGGVPRGCNWTSGITQAAWYLGFMDGIVVLVCLPLESMKVFEKHLQLMITTTPISSSL